jgi:hypothetical protein
VPRDFFRSLWSRIEAQALTVRLNSLRKKVKSARVSSRLRINGPRPLQLHAHLVLRTQEVAEKWQECFLGG